ncbi:TPM domain-containing protein [Agromyces sp. SYSU T00266]|uniref:TPM domain-containing protein n=1 Tax=Agromyces zhanjiangensis TaxID=3158562 RepID=UPI003392AE98
MRSVRRGSIAVAVLIGLTLLQAPAAANADQPVEFGASPVVDTAGALTADEVREVEAAIDDAADRSGRQLFVAYVGEFEDPADAGTWATETANDNNMGSEDYLLAVAIDGRAYHLSAAEDASLSAADIDRIAVQVIEPHLRDGDWAAAAIAGAEALGGGGSSGGGLGWLWIVLLIAAVVVVVAIVLVRRRRRGPAAPSEEAPAIPIDEVRRQAGGALIDADDALKTSEEELGFAVASFGDEATADFRTALAAANAKVREAFGLQQRLDDHEPDTEAQQREWYAGILRLTEEAEGLLDAQAERFDDLRALEQNAPRALASAEAAVRAAESEIGPAAARLQALASQYAPAALASVADNPEQARARIAFARDAATEAAAALGRGETGAAAVDIRAAEESADQARLLAAAVERLAADLGDGDRAAAAGIDDLDADVRTARGMSDPALAALADRVDAEATSLRAALGRAGRSPHELAARLDAVNREIDTAIQGARDAAVQAQRARAELDRALLSARSRVQAAEDYLVARRGAVGAEARTRLAEAGRLVVEAQSLSATDAAAALGAAQRADRLAGQAMSLAQRDVGGFGGSAGGGYGMPPGRGASGGDVFGAVLGGILIDSMLGGGRRGGGLGGVPGGFRGGRSSGGLGGGRRAPGSFGGSATRSRRGSGGRF